MISEFLFTNLRNSWHSQLTEVNRSKKRDTQAKEVIVPEDWMNRDKLTIPVMLKILRDNQVGKGLTRNDGKERLRAEIDKLKQVFPKTSVPSFIRIIPNDWGAHTHSFHIHDGHILCHRQENLQHRNTGAAAATTMRIPSLRRDQSEVRTPIVSSSHRIQKTIMSIILKKPNMAGRERRSQAVSIPSACKTNSYIDTVDRSSPAEIFRRPKTFISPFTASGHGHLYGHGLYQLPRKSLKQPVIDPLSMTLGQAAVVLNRTHSAHTQFSLKHITRPNATILRPPLKVDCIHKYELAPHSSLPTNAVRKRKNYKFDQFPLHDRMSLWTDQNSATSELHSTSTNRVCGIIHDRQSTPFDPSPIDTTYVPRTQAPEVVTDDERQQLDSSSTLSSANLIPAETTLINDVMQPNIFPLDNFKADENYIMRTSSSADISAPVFRKDKSVDTICGDTRTAEDTNGCRNQSACFLSEELLKSREIEPGFCDDLLGISPSSTCFTDDFIKLNSWDTWHLD